MSDPNNLEGRVVSEPNQPREAMSEQIDDGGPAFVIPGGGCLAAGMTLRDYFAAAALQGMVGVAVADAARNRVKPERIPPQLATGAYAIADAMLAARKEKP